MTATTTRQRLPKATSSPARAGRQEAEQTHRDRERDLEYVHHPSFSLPPTARRLWGPNRERIDVRPFLLQPEATEGNTVTRATHRPLTADQERTLFLRYNYAKYRLKKLAEQPDTADRRTARAWWRRRARRVREKIIHANLPLVPAMAKRKRVERVEFADKVAEGYMAVLRCVEHFDVSRGFKFSTYACRAILSALYRLGSKAQTYRKHVPVYFEPEYERDDHKERRDQRQRTDAIQSVRTVLDRNDAELSEIQEEIIRKRYPVGRDKPPMPLWKIGRDLGVSTERVRQIERASLGKLAGTLDNMLAT